MTAPSDWIEHRRGDGELLGWMRPRGDGFVVIDLLGRERSDAIDWLAAETLLEETGIGYLADAYELRLEDGHWTRVRITEVSAVRIRVKREDWGDMTVPHNEYLLPFPPAGDLRPVQTA
ncbi:hypothetical protein [Pseudoclavibacter sp. VKM Ac-2867]|uniref:hypothetical protein n=1 Tax=Pseudoclavibacter sp. VKM Ac-2867 TaxID=2783829 RepID=UPI00188BF9F5|nr:hypothetical protein [Pseudoclavibacter sp. VKM Ac-2867]MBF4458602.1 hypothetical protein [Pseudoclavibacter sp. VKM Ac-2867]